MQSRALCRLCFALCVICGLGLSATRFLPASDILDKAEFVLRTEDFPRGWAFHCARKGVRLPETWTLRKAENPDDSVLVCTGRPLGYLRTVKTFQNFELQLQWKYPRDVNGNSGVLIYTAGDDRIWPTSVQVQLHGPTAGSIFPVGGAATDNTLAVKDLKLPVDTWHDCLIVCREGTVTVSINGKKLGTVTGCIPGRGYIALQSEESEVHFRRMRLKSLD